ncbi:hypothetical protein BCR39DRAFT_546238 [Naematelia encephala]|uniref:Dynamitin-domain-containing protein n=1 Tax=Naematelia encephala TaxID=71784 RepID=A0A1Y2AQ71_9TREE|nr:hypothetical protein BCR39DRAFT_546238 [Naematelia encephala]
MSSKYHNLPDIDTAADVFETADEPEQILRPSENILGDEEGPVKVVSENIDSSTLPGRRKIDKVFGRRTRKHDSSYPSFRPRLPPLSRHASTSESDSDSSSPSLPPTARLRETPAARLKRLKLELEEVEMEIQAGPSTLPPQSNEAKRKSVLPKKEPVDLMGELVGLRERLEGVRLDGVTVHNGVIEGGDLREKLDQLGARRIGQGEAGKDADVTREAAIASEPPKSGQLSDIDTRLAQLEALIGPSERSSDSAQPPLLSALGKLDHLLSLLTQPRHLDAISRRLKLLLVDLDRAAAASRRPAGSANLSSVNPPPGGEKPASGTLSQADHANLQSLFALLPRLDPLIPIVPPLLARLRSLAILHTEAGAIVDDLKTTRAEEKREAEEIKELQEVVERVDTGLSEAAKAIKRNWEGLEERLSGLEERIKALKA